VRLLRHLHAELAFLAGVTWLEARMVRLTAEETGAELDALEARRAARLQEAGR
jgi:hypothetical protein